MFILSSLFYFSQESKVRFPEKDKRKGDWSIIEGNEENWARTIERHEERKLCNLQNVRRVFMMNVDKGIPDEMLCFVAVN